MMRKKALLFNRALLYFPIFGLSINLTELEPRGNSYLHSCKKRVGY